MSQPTDKRLIEHYIPIKQISAEASREKSIRHGHISTLHLWWARRPLVACRAAVFAALVPAPKAASKKTSELTSEDRDEEAKLNKLMIDLCKWEVGDSVLEEARQRIRDAYPDGPPKVLDMFAGGGSIPLEALRLGCEAYALDLNPVAHIIELATLVYPQKYGKQLAEDVRKWGEWVLERVRAEVGDLYPLILDPEATVERTQEHRDRVFGQDRLFYTEGDQLPLAYEAGNADEDEALPSGTDVPPGHLMPVAYLWTRTVICPNPDCRATVPLVRQTWLKKKKGDNVALEMRPHPTENRMAFYVRKAQDEKDFGFDPAGFSQRGNSTCYRCGTTVTTDYVKQEGRAGRISTQMMATVCVRSGVKGKVYLSPDEMDLPLPDKDSIHLRIEALVAKTGISVPNEEIETNPRSMDNDVYGFMQWSSLFTDRQLLSMLTFVKYVHQTFAALLDSGTDSEYATAVTTYLGLNVSRLTNFYSALCVWYAEGGRGVRQVFVRQALPMVWDFAESNPFNPAAASWPASLRSLLNGLESVDVCTSSAHVQRSSATAIPLETSSLQAIVTDPPYYDNVSYSNLSDFFYVWLSRAIGNLYPEHFSASLTPKKNEAISARYRHGDKDEQARAFYENMMSVAFSEASRVLEPRGIIVTIYAHKTTAGWSTLIEAMRNAGFSVLEAWPLETEQTHRVVSQGVAALASSILLIARKREDGHVADYAQNVEPDMRRIVAKRVRFLLQMGVSGADLNIATVGAGLAPYTRYARVELPNGEELTAAAYLDEVQAEVVRVLLGEASQTDPPTQYAIMARTYYGEAWVDFDEANNLARATSIELDSGPQALTKGVAALVEKSGSKVRIRTYIERGAHDTLGLRDENGAPAPLIDVLHRLLWLAENDNSAIDDFLNQAMPDKYKLRLVAESLKGRVLAAEPTPGAMRDDRTAEQRAIDVLLASWNRIVRESKMI